LPRLQNGSIAIVAAPDIRLWKACLSTVFPPPVRAARHFDFKTTQQKAPTVSLGDLLANIQ
jgi:hypothetical protein